MNINVEKLNKYMNILSYILLHKGLTLPDPHPESDTSHSLSCLCLYTSFFPLLKSIDNKSNKGGILEYRLKRLLFHMGNYSHTNIVLKTNRKYSKRVNLN